MDIVIHLLNNWLLMPNFYIALIILQKLACRSRERKRKNEPNHKAWKCSILIGLSRRFCFRLRPSGSSLNREWRSHIGDGRKWKRPDYSASDSVALMAPLTTPFFYIYIFTRSQALLVGFTIFDCNTLTSKTSLYEGDFHLLHTFSTDVFPTYVQRMEAKCWN